MARFFESLNLNFFFFFFFSFYYFRMFCCVIVETINNQSLQEKIQNMLRKIHQHARENMDIFRQEHIFVGFCV